MSRAVYTVLFGDYEELNNDHAPQDGITMLCLTDNPDLESDVWDVVVVEPTFPMDSVRSQRLIKISGHERLTEFHETLYIDNSVTLTGSASALLEQWLDGYDVAMPIHSFRSSLADEFVAVIRDGLDDLGRVVEQYEHYALMGVDFEVRPLWSAMIARRHTPEVQRAFGAWAAHMLRYSRRDQLSNRVALTGVSINEIDGDNYHSDYHTWPQVAGRKTHVRAASSEVYLPLQLRAGKAEAERRASDAELAAAQEQIALLSSRLTALDAELRTRLSTRIARRFRNGRG